MKGREERGVKTEGLLLLSNGKNPEGGEMMEEKKKLLVILNHWMEHNESHIEEYRKWAEKAGQLGLESVKTNIQKAIENLLRCNLNLKEALKEC